VSASFVVPNCCIGLIQFHFDVLISEYLFCLLSVAKFYVLFTCLSIYLPIVVYKQYIPPDNGLQICPRHVEVD